MSGVGRYEGDGRGPVAGHVRQCAVDPGYARHRNSGPGEMYPLNGPSWSLFFEYIGNILYALIIRKFSTKALAVLVVAAGCGLAAFSIFGPYGDICAGFSLTGTEFTGGFFRLLYAFSAGLLLSRVFKPARVRGAFGSAACS